MRRKEGSQKMEAKRNIYRRKYIIRKKSGEKKYSQKNCSEK